MKPQGGTSGPKPRSPGSSPWGVPAFTIFDDGWLRVLFDHPRVDVMVKVEHVRGVPEIVALHVDASDPLTAGGVPAVITSTVIHRIPLRQLKDEYRKLSSPSYGKEPHNFWQTPRRGPTPLPLERFREVAVIYRQAVAEGSSPLQAIKDRFHVERATASKYIKRAREEKFLGPARSGRPGEDLPASKTKPPKAAKKGRIP